MIRKIFEFLLSGSLDRGKPLPSWLQRFINRDDELNRYDGELRQLDQALRSSAAEHRQAMATSQDTNNHRVPTLSLPPHQQLSSTVASRHHPARHHPIWWMAGLAAAAVVLLMVTPSSLTRRTPEVHAGEFSQQLTTVPGEVLRLLTQAAETSQTQLPQLSPLAKLSVPKLPSWKEVAISVESPVRQELDIWQEGWQNIRSRLTSSTQEL